MIFVNGGILEGFASVLRFLKVIVQIVHGLAVAFMGLLMVLGGMLVAYHEEIYDVLTQFPGFVFRVATTAATYLENVAGYLQDLVGVYDGYLAPTAAFLNTFLPISETFNLLVFIGAFAVVVLVVRVCFKLTIVFR